MPRSWLGNCCHAADLRRCCGGSRAPDGIGRLWPRRSDSDYRWNWNRSARQCAGGYASGCRSRDSRNWRGNAPKRFGENANGGFVARNRRQPRKNFDGEPSRKSQGCGGIAGSSRASVSARGSCAARRPARLTLLSAVSRQSSELQDNNFQLRGYLRRR